MDLSMWVTVGLLGIVVTGGLFIGLYYFSLNLDKVFEAVTGVVPQKKKYFGTFDQWRKSRDNPFLKFYYSLIRAKDNTARSFRWAVRMWSNKEWDYSYLLEVNKYKLEDMLKTYRMYLVQYGANEDTQRICSEIEEAIRLVTVILEDRWEFGMWKEHDKKWGKLKMRFVKPAYDKEGKYIGRELKLSRPKANTPAKVKQEAKENKALRARIQEEHERKRREFCMYLSDHMCTWWD